MGACTTPLGGNLKTSKPEGQPLVDVRKGRILALAGMTGVLPQGSEVVLWGPSYVGRTCRKRAVPFPEGLTGLAAADCGAQSKVREAR